MTGSIKNNFAAAPDETRRGVVGLSKKAASSTGRRYDPTDARSLIAADPKTILGRKNNNQETSRDRFNGTNLGKSVADLEREMARIGYGEGYCLAIRKKVTGGREDAHALHLYRTALQRTMKAKAARASRAQYPF
jgi:hypothetical protein